MLNLGGVKIPVLNLFQHIATWEGSFETIGVEVYKLVSKTTIKCNCINPAADLVPIRQNRGNYFSDWVELDTFTDNNEMVLRTG